MLSQKLLIFSRLSTLILGWLVSDGILADHKTMHSEKSVYQDVIVRDEGSLRCLSFGSKINQACRFLDTETYLSQKYSKTMISALALHPLPRKILLIGLGGGVMPSAIRVLYPEAHLEIVELDPAVAKVATRFFGWVESEREKLTIGDGRVFVKRAIQRKDRFDVVFVDAFDAESIPFHLTTREFATELLRLSGSEGLVVVNLLGGEKLTELQSRSYRAVFSDTYAKKMNNQQILIGAKQDLSDFLSVSSKDFDLIKRFQAMHISLDDELTGFEALPAITPDSDLLTDQKAPPDLKILDNGD